MDQRTCERCGRDNPRPRAPICWRCKKSLENAKARGTTAPEPLDSFDCAQCGKRCVRGTDVPAQATRFCSVPCKKRWHHEHTDGQRVGYQQDARWQRWTARLFAEPTRVDLTAYRRALRADPCSYCGGSSEALDHITPKRAGGHDELDNRTASCHRCNSTKGTLSLLHALLFVPVATEYHELRRIFYPRAA